MALIKPRAQLGVGPKAAGRPQQQGAAGVVFTPAFIDLVAPGFHGASRELTIDLVRILPGWGIASFAFNPRRSRSVGRAQPCPGL